MKALVFDAGPLISLTMNSLLWIIPKMREHFNGEFYITKAVRNEVVDFPLTTKKYKFEAIQVLELIDSGALRVIDNDIIKEKTISMLKIANSIFRAYDHYINILHYAEVSVIAASSSVNSNTIAVDEKTTRLLIENPQRLRDILKRTLHTNIYINVDNLKMFRRASSGIRVIRSVELAAVAYELGILNRFIGDYPNSRQNLMDGILWGIKLKGCSVSEKEINRIVKLEAE